MASNAQTIADNLNRVRERIAEATRRNGRQSNSVKLVAVTKYVGVEAALALVAADCNDLGESRPQDLWSKATTLDAGVRWHLIGHLQRNKVRRTLPLVSLIHSIDSRRLLEAVNQEAVQINQRIPALLEVNISGDAAKHGFKPEEIPLLLPQLDQFASIEIKGLMAMGSLEGGPDRARDDFRRLRELRDRLQVNRPSGVKLDELSMGMSDDFEIAIEEGATIVRVGSALFEGLEGKS